MALSDLIPELRQKLRGAADPDRSPTMAAYMKHHFEYLGVTSPERRQIQKPFVAAGKGATSSELLDTAEVLWAEPQREFQYVGVDLLRRWVRSLVPSDLHRIEGLIRSKSWWDTVDGLAPSVVGPMVTAHPDLVCVMDEWIGDDDFWIARSAILHQLKFRERTDTDRLFGYVDRRCGDSEFFIRKACGWALREYAKTDPDAVVGFVHDRGDRLSGLTRREALKHL
jgi:3-methyladenine DNA glycosylase AlkD